ncbi:hypothetical protein D3C87_64180 [compost metagenome]
MINQSQIYKFVSLRNPKSEYAIPEGENIVMESALIGLLTAIIESDSPQNVKLENYNSALQNYIDSADFIKTKREFAAFTMHPPTSPKVEALYNNIIVRTLTKSNTNQMYKLIVEEFKKAYQTVFQSTSPFHIAIPDSITPHFIGYKGVNNPSEEEDTTEKEELVKTLETLSKVETLLLDAKKDHIAQFSNKGKVEKRNLQVQGLLSYLGKDAISTNEAKAALNSIMNGLTTEQTQTKIFNREIGQNVESTIADELRNNPSKVVGLTNQLSKYMKMIDTLEDQNVTDIRTTDSVDTEKYNLIFDVLEMEEFTIEEGLAALTAKMDAINTELKTLVGEKKYSFIGSKWVNVSNFEQVNMADELANDLFTQDNACDLKFPYQIADLRVVETETVGYLPGEIAHINNTQAGEKNVRETRRLKRTESSESYLIDEETFRETDSQSTEKFSLENVSSAIQAKANEISVHASASGSFGPVSASVDTGFSNSSSSVNSSIVAQKEAKEVFEKVVDRVSKRVKSERSTLTIEEFEEKVTHEIDNSTQGTKSYVYRWMNKLIRGTLKNYGKRLIFECDIVHPAHYYLSQSINKVQQLAIPDDPRKVAVKGSPVLTIDNITRDNYLVWASLYNANIEQPPVEKIIVSETLNGTQTTTTSKMTVIPDNYFCYSAKASAFYYDHMLPSSYLFCTVGLSDFASWGNGDAFFWNNVQLWCNGETKQIPISITAAEKGFYVNVEVECHLSQEAYKAWKISTYNSIVSAYEELVSKIEEDFITFDPNNPGINPLKKDQKVAEEIKRETIRKMFRCNPFWLKDNYQVGQEYQPVCCSDSSNAQKVKFIETAFDWENMTYQLHPYFYSDKKNWADLLELTDDNPHFEAFMQASYATVRIPVHRDQLKERAAINFLQFNSIANYDIVPEGFETLLAELGSNEPEQFEYDIDGNLLPEPTSIIDLGVFKVPTDLVILECGNRDGVKPIGYPQSNDEPTSDVIIPKQYSPAIIADSCNSELPPLD